MNTPVHANWATQPRSAKFYHLATVHGMDLHTRGRERYPNELEVSTGFLDDTHKFDHQNPDLYLVNREHWHNGSI
jgi:hypothetical protein